MSTNVIILIGAGLLAFALITAVILIIVLSKRNKSTQQPNMKYSQQSAVASTEGQKLNDTLSKMLSHGFSGTSIIQTSYKMISILKGYYRVEYVTLFTYTKQGWFNITATNIPNDRITQTEKYYNQQSKGMQSHSKVTIVEGYNPESFLSNYGLEYSNFTLLYHEGRVIGAVLLEHTKQAEIAHRQFDIYEQLFNATALVLNHLIEVSELVAMVSTDQLTGVYNRRFIDITLAEEVEKHRMMGQTFNVALMDIDHFKKFNDTYGHQFGDVVLQEVSKYIKGQMGKYSWVARYGGEEFLVFFAKSDIQRVYEKLENIREGISNLNVTYNGSSAKVTASFGVANYPANGINSNDIIARADDALYKSKERGRNRVTIYGS